MHKRRTWLNLELIKKPAHCLEYIVVHEMVPLLERHHSDRFVGYIKRFMPLWRYYREELNRTALGDNEGPGMHARETALDSEYEARSDNARDESFQRLHQRPMVLAEMVGMEGMVAA